MVNDISRAFFHAKVTRDVYVQLPNEDKAPGEEQLCGKLRFSMYGTRDAAQNWHQEYTQQLLNVGFEQGKASSCIFYHPQKNIRTYVHGDDYVSRGQLDSLKWMRARLEEKYQVKTQLLGPNEGQCQQLKILNRVVEWHGQRGIAYEADPRHVELVIEQLNLKDANAVTTPGTREEGRTKEEHEEVLGEKEATKYRAVIARCNYISPDRPDISYAVKELARGMAHPIHGDMQRLRRLGRYLKGKPRLQQWYEWQPSQATITTYSDADWAGCKNTRKSTIGGCIVIGKHNVKPWSRTQSLIALSSGESELYSSLKAAAETLGMLSMTKDFAWNLKGEVWADASAALGIINRKGLGKTRHIHIGLLWIQQTAAEQRLRFHKVLGKQNPADLFTKHLDELTNTLHITKLGCNFTTGRAAEAPKLHLLSQSRYHEDQHKEDSRPWEWLNFMNRESRETSKESSRGTIKSWRQESRTGETRDQFLSRKWQEILATYPRTAEDT